jgi:hypothetical protein
METTKMNQIGKSSDEKTRITQKLLESYKSLIFQEAKARENNNQKHLAACLSGQQKVLDEINRLLLI